MLPYWSVTGLPAGLQLCRLVGVAEKVDEVTSLASSCELASYSDVHCTALQESEFLVYPETETNHIADVINRELKLKSSSRWNSNPRCFRIRLPAGMITEDLLDSVGVAYTEGGKSKKKGDFVCREDDRDDSNGTGLILLHGVSMAFPAWVAVPVLVTLWCILLFVSSHNWDETQKSLMRSCLKPGSAAATPAAFASTARTSTRWKSMRTCGNSMLRLKLYDSSFINMLLVTDLCFSLLYAFTQLFADAYLLTFVFIAAFLPTFFVGPVHVGLWWRRNFRVVTLTRLFWESDKENRPQSFKCEDELQKNLKNYMDVLHTYRPALNWIQCAGGVQLFVAIVDDLVRSLLCLALVIAFVPCWLVYVNIYWIPVYVWSRWEDEQEKLTKSFSRFMFDNLPPKSVYFACAASAFTVGLPGRAISGESVRDFCRVRIGFRDLKDTMKNNTSVFSQAPESTWQVDKNGDKKLPYCYMSDNLTYSLAISHAFGSILHVVFLFYHRYASMPAKLTIFDSAVWWCNVISSGLVIFLGMAYLLKMLGKPIKEDHQALFFTSKWFSDTPCKHDGEVGINFRAKENFFITALGRQLDIEGSLQESRLVSLWDANLQAKLAHCEVGGDCTDEYHRHELHYAFHYLERPIRIQKGKEYRISQSCDKQMKDKWFDGCIPTEEVELYTAQEYAEFKGGVCSKEIGKYPSIIGGTYGNAGVVNFKIKKYELGSISGLLETRTKKTSEHAEGSGKSGRFGSFIATHKEKVKGDDKEAKVATLLGNSGNGVRRQKVMKDVRQAGCGSAELKEALTLGKEDNRVIGVPHYYHAEKKVKLEAEPKPKTPSTGRRLSVESLDLHLPVELGDEIFKNKHYGHGGYGSDSEVVAKSKNIHRLPPVSPRHSVHFESPQKPVVRSASQPSTRSKGGKQMEKSKREEQNQNQVSRPSQYQIVAAKSQSEILAEKYQAPLTARTLGLHEDFIEKKANHQEVDLEEDPERSVPVDGEETKELRAYRLKNWGN